MIMIDALVLDDSAIFDAAVLACLDTALVQARFVVDVADVQRALQSTEVDILLLSTHLDRHDFCRRLRLTLGPLGDLM